MSSRLDATISGLPPSVNSLYEPAIIWKGKKQVPIIRKTAACRKYETHAKEALGKAWMFSEKLDPNKPYELNLFFYLEKVVNAGWPKTKTKFVKRDVNNFIKLLEDVIAKVSGVDDRAVFDTHIFKRKSSKEGSEWVDIVVQEIGEECLT